MKTVTNKGQNCKVANCSDKAKTLLFCGKHYQRVLKTGSPNQSRYLRTKGKTEASTFWMRVAVTSNPEKCWNWLGGISSTGYGTFKYKGRYMGTHRAAYLIFYQTPIQSQVLHSCDNRLCCNPHHLRDGTQLDNMQEAVERNRIKSGELSHKARLSDDDILFIKQQFQFKVMSAIQLAKQFNINRRYVYQLVKQERRNKV